MKEQQPLVKVTKGSRTKKRLSGEYFYRPERQEDLL